MKTGTHRIQDEHLKITYSTMTNQTTLKKAYDTINPQIQKR